MTRYAPSPEPEPWVPTIPIAEPFKLDDFRLADPSPTRTEFLQAIESLKATVRDEVAAVVEMLKPLMEPTIHVESPAERRTVRFEVRFEQMVGVDEGDAQVWEPMVEKYLTRESARAGADAIFDCSDIRGVHVVRITRSRA